MTNLVDLRFVPASYIRTSMRKIEVMIAASAVAMNGTSPTSVDHTGQSHAELEAKLVAAHAAFGDAMQLQAKYDGMLADDDQRRTELRANAARRPS
jgi:hypothetical protein